MKSDIMNREPSGFTPVVEYKVPPDSETSSTECRWTENVQTWYGFSQNTTVHGVKYIFEQGYFKLRRYVLIINHKKIKPYRQNLFMLLDRVN